MEGRKTVGLAVVLLLLLAAAPAAESAIAGKTGSQALDLAMAMESLPGLVTGASFVVYGNPSPPSYPAAVADTPVGPVFGMPAGPDYAILSSGDAERADDTGYGGSTGLGTSYSGGNDVTVLEIGLLVPAGHDCLSFDFQFLSREYPTYVGSSFNDAFIAELDAQTWSVGFGGAIAAPDNYAVDGSGNPVTINSATMTAANAAGTPYGGGTDPLTAMTPITPGAHTLYLSVFDASDSSLDSVVLLDDLRTGATAPGTCYSGISPPVPTAVLDAIYVPCHNDVALFQDLSFTGPKGKLVKAEWDFGDGSKATFAPPEGNVSHLYEAPGVYTVKLTVTQADGVTANTTETITVCNGSPVVDAGGDRFVLVGHGLLFTITASDPDGDPFSIAVAGAPVTVDTATPPDHTVYWKPSAADVGVHAVTVTATDVYGAAGSGTVQIEVLPPGGVPDGRRDGDADGIPDTEDLCPAAFDPAQSDGDGDGTGDACEATPPAGSETAVRAPAQESGSPEADGDGDGVVDRLDRCPRVRDDGADLDGDQVGDACDPDLDGDGVPQLDALGRYLDVCPFTPDDQADLDDDGVGDACDGDRDADGVPDDGDNCVWVPNADQVDLDADGRGDACDAEVWLPDAAEHGSDDGPEDPSDGGPDDASESEVDALVQGRPGAAAKPGTASGDTAPTRVLPFALAGAALLAVAGVGVVVLLARRR